MDDLFDLFDSDDFSFGDLLKTAAKNDAWNKFEKQGKAKKTKKRVGAKLSLVTTGKGGKSRGGKGKGGGKGGEFVGESLEAISEVESSSDEKRDSGSQVTTKTREGLNYCP